MNEKNVKRHENQVIRKVFDDAKAPSKVIIVGLDYAEKTHKTVICNGHGDIFLKPFSIRNNADGLAFLIDRINTQIGKHGMRSEHVIIGGETPGSWAQNFVANLIAAGQTVIDLHAKKVKKYRENETTDNDTLAAETVCRMLIDKDGRQHVYDGIYKELKETVRTRSRLVRKKTRASNQLHTCADTYFPGLLDSKLSGLCPLSKPSLFVLAEHSLGSICRCRHKTLTAKLAKSGAQGASETATKLKQLAAKALPPTEAEERARRMEIDFLIAQYRLLNEQVTVCHKRVAELLRQTPGCLLTTVGGIGVTLASQLVAELGPPEDIESVASKVCNFGLTQKSHQTGGDDKAPHRAGRPKQFNHIGKGVILGISQKLAQMGPEEYRQSYRKHRLEGKNADYALARKCLRFAISVMKMPHEYIPPLLRQMDRNSGCWEHHFRDLEKMLRAKWRPLGVNLQPEQDYLKRWENMGHELYNVNISV